MKCECFLPRRADCEHLGFPEGCYHRERERAAELVERYLRETLGFGPDSIGKTLARVIRTGSDCPYPGIDAKAHGWWVGE